MLAPLSIAATAGTTIRTDAIKGEGADIRSTSWVRAVAVIAVAGIAAACTSSAGGGTSSVPARPQVGSRVLCQDQRSVTAIVVERLNAASANHIAFAFPASVRVTGSGQVRAVVRELCALPANTRINCPVDSGVRYQIRFLPAALHLASVSLDPSGCRYVTGLGTPRRYASEELWKVLAEAMAITTPGVAPLCEFSGLGQGVPCQS